MTLLKSILLLAPNDFKSIPTLNRYIDAFSGRYTVYGAGLAPPDGAIDKFIVLTRKVESEQSLLQKLKRKIKDRFLGLISDHESRYWIHNRLNQLKDLQALKPDLIIVQNVFMLPIAFKILAPHTKVIFDSQEYHPSDYESNSNSKEGLYFIPIINMILNRYLPLCTLMFTYNNEIRRLYLENYSKDSELFTSASNYKELDPQPVIPECIRLVHHGIAVADRKLENFIELAKLLKPCFKIELMLTRNNSPYYKQLLDKASTQKNISFRDPVPTNKIVETINEFDIGIMIVPPNNLNCLYMSPNKFWEYIQARLCTLFFPYPVIKQITNEYETGFTSDDFTIQSMADKLNSLDAESIFKMKQSNHRHAYELSAEVQKQKINLLIDSLLK